MPGIDTDARLPCRETLEPGLQKLIAAAQSAGWSDSEIHLTLIRISTDALKAAGMDIATIVELRQVTWNPALQRVG